MKSFTITTNSHYVANGAESAIYRCYTDDDIEVQARDPMTFSAYLFRSNSQWIPLKDIPIETALKIYFISDPMAKDWKELEQIDAQKGCLLALN